MKFTHVFFSFITYSKYTEEDRDLKDSVTPGGALSESFILPYVSRYCYEIKTYM